MPLVSRVLRPCVCQAAYERPLMVVHPLQGGGEDHGRSYKAFHSSDRWPCKVIPYSSPRSPLLTQANQFPLKDHLSGFHATHRCFHKRGFSHFPRRHDMYFLMPHRYRLIFVETAFPRCSNLLGGPARRSSILPYESQVAGLILR